MENLKQLKIEEYSLVDFVMKIQQGILDGYVVTDKSDDAPLQIGGGFHVIMREATKPIKVVSELAFEASIDTVKLQEQLKDGGEIEQALADSLVVAEKTDVVHETFIEEVPKPEPEPTMDEALPKEEQVTEQKLSDTEFVELVNKTASLINKVDNLLVEAEAKHIEATTPVKATPKQTRGKKQ